MAISFGAKLWLLHVLLSFVSPVFAGNFYQDVDITWGDGRASVADGGQVLALSLDKLSGSGFQSKDQYQFGRIDVQLKLVPGNSAGTVATLYVRTSPEHIFL